MQAAVSVAAVQMARRVGDKRHNIARIVELIDQAAASGADIVVFPELATTGYFATEHDLKWFDLAEPRNGPTMQTLSAAARSARIDLVVPFFEFEPHLRTYFNSANVINRKGDIVGTYRKRHIPETLWMYEKFYFTPGNLGHPVFDLGCKIGVSICYDRHFPETFRHLTSNGAEVIFSVNNTPTVRSRRVWDAEMIASASGNGVYIVQLNAVGKEGTQTFFGNSLIASPDGTISDRLDEAEGMLFAKLELDEIQRARTHYSVMRDTRWEDLGLDGLASKLENESDVLFDQFRALSP